MIPQFTPPAPPPGPPAGPAPTTGSGTAPEPILESPLLWFNSQCEWADVRRLEVVAVQFCPEDVPRLPSYWGQGLRNIVTARTCPATVGDYRSVRLAEKPPKPARAGRPPYLTP